MNYIDAHKRMLEGKIVIFDNKLKYKISNGLLMNEYDGEWQIHDGKWELFEEQKMKDLTFGEALEFCQMGYSIRCNDWENKKDYVYLYEYEREEKGSKLLLRRILCHLGTFDYCPSNSDLFSENWEAFK